MILQPIDFSVSDPELFAGYDYGQQSYALELNDWLRTSTRQTLELGGLIWKYCTPSGDHVGFGSLECNPTNWKDARGDQLTVVTIPAVAIVFSFQGQPPTGSAQPKYSDQIMSHLVRIAHELAPLVPGIGLVAHSENKGAIEVYSRWDFEQLPEPITFPPDEQTYFQMVRPNRGE